MGFIRHSGLVILGLAFSLPLGTVAAKEKKKLLAIGMSAGWQHDSVSDALATLYRLGRESSVWDTTIRTDTELVSKKKLKMNAKNLDYFDAVFFMTTGELPLDQEQKAALLSFIREDGKGFLGAHNATDTFYHWPEYGKMIGGYFDGHPWNQFQATLRVEDRRFPATRHFPESFQILDEIYQFKDFSPRRVRVLMSLETENLDMNKEGVRHRYIPVAWARNYGKGRVFYCGLGHRPEVWSRTDIQQMWLGAIKWAMGLIPGDAAPRPSP
ncbi:MAG: ThuA domain-containing protein [Acidobacteriota bacterium]